MGKEKNIPHVVITAMNRYSYFQWFILGFYYLEKEGKIELSFKVRSLYERLSFLNRSKLMTGFRRYAVKYGINLRWLFHFSNNLEGYVLFDDEKRYFCIDSNDNPFSFDSELLDKVSVYYKMQCPKDFSEDGFHLTDDVVIPWIDQNIERNPKKEKVRKPCKNLFKNIAKIRPLMVGTRLMSRGNAFRWLDESFQNSMASSSVTAEKKMMCYFGNAQGPVPVKNDPADLDREAQIVGYFGDKTNHPNEKRAKAAKIMRGMGDKYDARVIDETEPGFKNRVSHPELVVPIDRFCGHISHFQYNLNISGYGMSIPNRFIESFLVGTAIVTDRLSLRWYKPFGSEVVETVPMGYLPMDQVNWEGFEKDIKNLPDVDKTTVLNAFNEKWHPRKVAEYILEEVLKCNNEKTDTMKKI